MFWDAEELQCSPRPGRLTACSLALSGVTVRQCRGRMGSSPVQPTAHRAMTCSSGGDPVTHPNPVSKINLAGHPSTFVLFDTRQPCCEPPRLKARVDPSSHTARRSPLDVAREPFALDLHNLLPLSPFAARIRCGKAAPHFPPTPDMRRACPS